MTGASFDFAGARVLVTGGTSGIGLAIARAFCTAGATVTVTGTRPVAAEYDVDPFLPELRFLAKVVTGCL